MNRLQTRLASWRVARILRSFRIAGPVVQAACTGTLLILLMDPVALAQESATPQPASPAAADEKDYSIYFQTSVYTAHFHSDPDHNDHQRLLNLEWRKNTGTVWGAAYFRNSFDQPSEYVYGGKIFRPFDSQQNAYFKLTGGLVHGYKGEYQDKIPFNSSGVAPVILPAAGFSYKNITTELTLFGDAGLMVTLGYDFH